MNQGFLKYCLLITCVLFTFHVAVAQVAAQAQLDSNVAETGNPFKIQLLVPVNAGKPLQVDFSAWDTILPQENVLAQSAATNQGQQYQIELTCITFDADTLYLPPLSIRLAGGKTALTNPLELVVLATPAPQDLNDMAEIKDIRHEPVWWTDYLPWIGVVATVIALIFLGNWWWKRRQKRGSRSRELSLPPDELARKKLVALTKKQLWQKGELKSYYAELTFIIREYLQKRYQIPALESTTDETLAYLKQRDFPPDLQAPLTEMLQQADLVKFAKSLPPEFFHEQALRQAQTLVESTRPPIIAADSVS